MELFKIFGSIGIKNKEAIDGMKETVSEGEKTSGALSKIGKAAGAIGKAALVGVTAATGAIAKLTKSAVDSYGQYEQLAGGVQKIFDEMDNSVIFADAQKAWKDLGLSANQYLSSINDVGATFASTMGDETGYKVARQGMLAISNYASGTGKDINLLNEKFMMITRATSSYQSIADQFSGILPATSADFLAQAQAAGLLSTEYKKLTAVPVAEYQQAVAAMLESGTAALGLAGNTAAEAENTFTGSMGALASMWANIKNALIDDTMDLSGMIVNLSGALSAFLDNLVPKITSSLSGIATLVSGMAPELVNIVISVFDQIAPGLISGIESILSAVVAVLPQALMTIIDYAPNILSALQTVTMTLFNALPALIQTLLTALNGDLLTNVIDTIFQTATAILEILPDVILPIIDSLPGLIEKIVNGILENLPMLVSAGMDLLVALANGVSDAIPQLVAIIPGIIGTLIATLSQALPDILSAGIQILIALISGIGAAIPQLVAFVPQIMIIATETILANLDTIINGGIEILMALIFGLMDAIPRLVAAIPQIITAIAKTLVEFDWIGTGKKVLQGIIDGIVAMKEKVAEKFQEVVDKLKNIFANLKLKFPEIKLPHFSISGKFSLNPISVPKLSIDWYDKAMDNAMLLNSPTIFGMNPNGELMGGGESGQEVVSGSDTLMRMIRGSVAEETSSVIIVINRLIDMLAEYFPEIIANLQKEIVLDDGTLVGKIAPKMDKQLGNINKLKVRGI